MGIDDRDYMRDPKRIRRASDQRAPGDPRRAGDVFLPGTVHAAPRRLWGRMLAILLAVVVTVAAIAIAMTGP